MDQTEQLQKAFTRLREILQEYETSLNVISDLPDNYYLETHQKFKNNKPLFFGAVKIKKNSVGFYLMPVYIFPELLAGISYGLKKKMTGKSCFHFTITDQTLLDELNRLTRSGFELFLQLVENPELSK